VTSLPLTLDDVSFTAGDALLLKSVSLALAHGPKTMILGANGAGKSLLLRICHGLLGPTHGRVRWAGAERLGSLRRRQAMVFQKPVLLRRSVRANAAYGLKIAGVVRDERRDRVTHVLERVGLAGLADRDARVLSGGEQQKLALARAWVLEPEILFLDEPTANLDPGATAAVEAIVDEIYAAGTKIVMTTQSLAQARRLADDIVFIHRGSVAEQTPADVFFASPQSREAASFLKGELAW
jgi:tungstate transport system ATP-binding protein